jgi:hypothetical protein
VFSMGFNWLPNLLPGHGGAMATAFPIGIGISAIGLVLLEIVTVGISDRVPVAPPFRATPPLCSAA